MYNNLNNSFYDEGVRNNKNELSYNNDLTFKSIRLESPVSIYLENYSKYGPNFKFNLRISKGPTN